MEVKKLDFGTNAPFAFETSLTEVKDNIFLVDWFTFTAFGHTPESILSLLGLSKCPFVRTERGMNGYPCRLFFNGISILFGADDPSEVGFEKVRDDMGICINMSGTGCRTFESHGFGDWFSLFQMLFTFTDVKREKNGRVFSYNVSRLDLAFDDHTGIFDINILANKVKDREYISPFKSSSITWSDNQEYDLIGLNINIGSPSSDILFRIYNKAAERGFKDRHWVRFEMQLRNDRALSTVDLLRFDSISNVFLGILKHYLRFVDPDPRVNKSRWSTSAFWYIFLKGIEEANIVTPGSEYNFSKTEFYHRKQYGQFLRSLIYVYDDLSLLEKNIRDLYDFESLDPKYKNFVRTGLMEGIR